MKIKRTQHEHFYDRADWPRLKNAGEVTLLEKSDMRRIFFNHNSLVSRITVRPGQDPFDIWWPQVQASGGFTTWGAKYEIVN